MDSLLVTVTVISIAIAGAMTLQMWRMIREERRRAAARLAALADEDMDFEDKGEIAADRWRGTSEPARVLAPAPVGQATEQLFATATRPASPSRIALALPLVAVVGVLVGAAAYLGDGPNAAPGPAKASAVEAAPLELLSMRHTRQGDTWTITGLVRNPETGTARKNIIAIAFLFDSTGSFLASGRAPLDFTSLGPADESPFVITISRPGAVSRYRISFRGDDGRLLRHVDRRVQASP